MTVLTRRNMHLEDSWDHRGAMDMGRKRGVSADAKLQVQVMKSGTRKEARLTESDNVATG